MLSILQVYVISVRWSDGTNNVIYRRYSQFFDLQVWPFLNLFTYIFYPYNLILISFIQFVNFSATVSFLYSSVMSLCSPSDCVHQQFIISLNVPSLISFWIHYSMNFLPFKILFLFISFNRQISLINSQRRVGNITLRIELFHFYQVNNIDQVSCTIMTFIPLVFPSMIVLLKF